MAQIYGELVRAQLQSSATDLTPTATGLVYFNTSTGLKWYTGSAWKIAVDLDSTQTLAGKTLDATCSVNSSALPIVPSSKGGLGLDASAFTGVIKAASGTFSAGTIVNADVNASAAIDHSKLASMTAGQVLLGNASNVPTATALTGDVTVSGLGVTAISSDVIVNADVKSDAAIAGTKISPDFGSQNVTTTGNIGGTNALITGYEELTEIATPSTPAAGKVRVYAKTDAKLYRLDDAGNESPIGSGGGSAGVNYLTDWYDATKAVGTVSTVAAGGNVTVSGSFPAVTSAWYADATSGAAAIASSSNNTLRGTTNYLTALSGASTSGATFVQSPVFNIDGGDLGKALTVQFDVSGNTTDNDWDVVAVRYTVSGTTATFAELIPIAGNVSSMTGTPSAKLPLGVKQFNGFFITGSTASDVYAIRWRRRNGSVAIRLDSLVVGPNQVLQGAIVTDWQSDSPTVIGFGAETSKSVFYRRVGNVMEIRGEFVGGTPTAVTASVALPAGLTVDSTTITTTSPVGYHFTSKGTADKKGGAVLVAASGTVLNFSNFGTFGTTATNPLAAALGTAVCESGDQFCFYASVPISQWQSNTQQAARAVEEYAYNSGTETTGSNTTSFAYGPQGIPMRARTAAGSMRVRFQTPILPTDSLFFEYQVGGTGSWIPLIGQDGSADLTNYMVQNGISYGANVVRVSGSSTDVDVRFGKWAWNNGTYGVDTAPGAIAWIANSFNWRVKKVSSGAAVGFPVGARNVIADTSVSVVPQGYIGYDIRANNSANNNCGATATYFEAQSFSLAGKPGKYLATGYVHYKRNAATYTEFYGQAAWSAYSGSTSTGIDSGTTMTGVDIQAFTTNWNAISVVAVPAIVITNSSGIIQSINGVDFSAANSSTLYLKGITGTYTSPAGTPKYNALMTVTLLG